MTKNTKTALFFIFVFLLILPVTSLLWANSSPPDGFSSYPFLYNLKKPDKIMKLPGELNEISGISFYNDTTLACIEDETARIYMVDHENEMIAGIYKFGKKGDYEDIEVVGDYIYVLKSSGMIIGIKDFDKETPEIKKFNTKLSTKNDTEGLCLQEDLLLIACKDLPESGKKKNLKYRAVYAYNPEQKKLAKEPFLSISFSALKQVAREANILPGYNFSLFQPSGIAIHPETKHYYIISAVGQLLVILDEKKEIAAIIPLPPAVFQHPEGICFSPGGTLFISNEARRQRANILTFHLMSR